MLPRLLLLVAATVAIASGQLGAPAEAPAPGKPEVEKLDDTRFRIGQIIFDGKTREIRFPVEINMTEDLLEFLIVHKNGKVHESLFKTDISPTHLNVAFALLRYKPSPELYSKPASDTDPTETFPEVPEEIRKAARLKIEVEWQDGERLRKIPVNEWVQHTATGSTMSADPWVYGGSEIVDGKFPPETTGDIVAIYRSQSALINYSGKDHGDDTVWIVYPKRVPPLDTKVTLIISPFEPAKP